MTSNLTDQENENSAINVGDNIKDISFAAHEKGQQTVKTETLNQVVEMSNTSLKYSETGKPVTNRRVGYEIY